MSESNSIGVARPRGDDVEEAPAPKIAKIAKEPTTITQAAKLLEECICDAVSINIWNTKDGGDFEEVLGDGFEFDKETMHVKITGADATSTYKPMLVVVVGPILPRSPVFNLRTHSEPPLAELVSLLYTSIEDILRDVLWYDNGGEYDEVIGEGFKFDDDTLSVKITGSDGTATYEVKLVKVESQAEKTK